MGFTEPQLGRHVAGVFWGLGLLACSDGGSYVVAGDFPEEAQSFLLALEQGEERLLYASSVSGGPLNVAFPEGFDASLPTTLTRISLRQALDELSVSAHQPLARSPAPSRAVATLSPLLVENSTILNVEVTASFLEGDAAEWLLEHPLPRPDRCLLELDTSLIATAGAPRELLAVSPELAVGVATDRTVVIRADGTTREIFHPLGEAGRSAALGRGGRVWVVTASSAAVIDLESGARSNEVLFEFGEAPVGMGEDLETGEIYVLTDQAGLWRRAPGAQSSEQIGRLADGDVRLHSFHKANARFISMGGGRMVAISDQVAGVIEIEGGEITVLRPNMTSEGISAILPLGDGRFLLADAKVGGLFEYEFGNIRAARNAPSGIIGMVPLDSGGTYLAYVTTYALLGSLDRASTESCPERLIGAWTDATGFVRLGDRFLMSGLATDGTYGWWWLDLVF